MAKVQFWIYYILYVTGSRRGGLWGLIVNPGLRCAASGLRLLQSDKACAGFGLELLLHTWPLLVPL
jgi:hypothetical protein